MMRFVFAQELKYNLRHPLIYIFALFFTVVSYFHFSNPGTGWNGIIHMGPIYRNSTYLIANMLLSLTTMGIFAVFLPAGNSILKDFSYNTFPFLFTSGLQKRDYIWGRFFGVFLSVLTVFIFGLCGIYRGSLALPNHLLGDYNPMHYLFPFLVYVVPNVFILTALFFSLGALKKNSLWLYAGAVIFLIYLFLLQGFVADLIRNQQIDKGVLLNALAFLDPLGTNTFRINTANWTLIDKNLKDMPVGLLVIAHRLLWIGIAVFLLTYTERKFEMHQPTNTNFSG